MYTFCKFLYIINVRSPYGLRSGPHIYFIFIWSNVVGWEQSKDFTACPLEHNSTASSSMKFYWRFPYYDDFSMQFLKLYIYLLKFPEDWRYISHALLWAFCIAQLHNISHCSCIFRIAQLHNISHCSCVTCIAQLHNVSHCSWVFCIAQLHNFPIAHASSAFRDQPAAAHPWSARRCASVINQQLRIRDQPAPAHPWSASSCVSVISQQLRIRDQPATAHPRSASNCASVINQQLRIRDQPATEHPWSASSLH